MRSLRSATLAVSLVSFAGFGAACTLKTVDAGPGGGAVAADGAPIAEQDGALAADGGAVVSEAGGPPRASGSVSLTYADHGTTKSLTGFAQFQDLGAEAPSLPTCQLETEGDCVLYLCAPSPPQPDAGTQSAKRPHAGAITFTGARLPANAQVVPDTNGKYTLLSETGIDAWAGGERLTVKAAGADVPAFTGTLVAPSPSVTLEAPVFAPPQKVEVDRKAPLALVWSSAGPGGGILTASASASASVGGRTASIVCRFDASKGSAAFPTKLLEKLPAGDGVFGASLSTTSQLNAGDYQVTLLASSVVKNAAGQVTFR